MTSRTEFGQCAEEEEVKVSQCSNGGNGACSTQLVSSPLDQEILQLLKGSVLDNGVDDQHQGGSNPSPEGAGHENQCKARM